MSFAVTGASRSGTMALARILNTSPTWTVNHQSDSDEIAMAHAHESLMGRFRQVHYGEVSCALLLSFPVLPAAEKYVILRDPRDCILSAWNYYHAVENADFALGNKAEMTWRVMDLLLGRYPFRTYKRIFSSTVEMRDFAEVLGVDDLPALDLGTQHNSYPKVVESWADLPDEVRLNAERDTDWFREKWAKDLEP